MNWLPWMSESKAVFIVGMFSTAAIFAVRPGLSYRVLELDLNASWAGILGAAYAVAPLLLILLIGRFVDRAGAGTAIAVGAAVMAGASATGPDRSWCPPWAD